MFKCPAFIISIELGDEYFLLCASEILLLRTQYFDYERAFLRILKSFVRKNIIL